MAKRSWFRRLIDLGVTDALTPIDKKHIRVTNFAAVVVACMLFQWVPLALRQGEWPTVVQNSLTCVVYLLVPLLNRRHRYTVAATLLLVTCTQQMLWTAWFNGTASASWLFFAPLAVLPYVILGRKHRRLSHLFATLNGAGLVWVSLSPDLFQSRVVLVDIQMMALTNTIFATVGLIALFAVFMSAVDDTENALVQEQERADALLLNVLPPSIAARLKAAPDEVIADRFEETTCLFADIVGFTPLSARISAERTVEILNEVFTAFDAFCEEEGVNKIKTIGDGYMAVSGAPEPREDHALAMVRVAIKMRDYMASQPTGEPLQVRIGLNSGEAVGGIVGTSRFHYDLWSDAVNVAARMESTGQPGKIHITRATRERIKDHYPCEPRGMIPVKGKGEMETWFLQ